MSEVVTWEAGARVKVTVESKEEGADPTEYVGTVDSHRGRWVMLDLDAPTTTSAGWSTSKMLARADQVSALET